MIEQDTIKLLRECDAGTKMGISSIDEVISHVNSDKLKERLKECRDEHKRIERELQMLLEKYCDDGKDPNVIAKGMSWMKTNLKLAVNESDFTIADLITDGCSMGIKSLNRYLNEYKKANEEAKSITKRLIHTEEKLAEDIKSYL